MLTIITKSNTLNAALETNSCNDGIKRIRKRLIETTVINPITWVFEEDFDFNSPSTPAQVVYGGSVDGWETWKNKNGETLNQMTGRNNTSKKSTP